MIALSVSADVALVLELGASRGSGDLAVSHGEAGGLEPGEGALERGGKTVVVAHAVGVEGVTRGVGGVADLVARVGDVRGGPGRRGDRVVDDRGGVAVVGGDAGVTQHRDDGAEGLAERLGGVGAGLVAHADLVGGDADVAVAAIVVQEGGDDGAGDALAAVDLGDLVGDLHGVGRGGHVERAGLDAGDQVGLLGLHDVEVGDLRGALVVVGVGREVHGAVGVVVELEGAGAHRGAVVAAGDGEVALGEAELVVLVVVEVRVAVVALAARGKAELVDHRSVDAVGGDGHRVVVVADDAGDVGGGVTGLDALGAHVVDVLGDELGEGGAGGLGLARGEVPVVGGADGLEEVGGGGVGRQVGVVPGRGRRGDVGGTGVLGAIVDDLLGELGAAVVDGRPEGVLLLLGPVGEVGVVTAGVADEGGQRGHAGAVLGKALDVVGVEGGGAVVGRVHVSIEREDDVVDGHRGAVVELEVVTKLDVVGDGAVGLLGHRDVGGAVVGVLGAVVLLGLAVDAVIDRLGHAVGDEERDVVEAHDILVGRGSGEQRAELALEAGGRDDERLVGAAALVGGGAAAVVAGGEGQRTHGGRGEPEHLPSGNEHLFPTFLP